MDWTLIFGVGAIALCVGYIVGGAIWTERPAPFETRSYTETFPPSDVDIDVPLTITRISRPRPQVLDDPIIKARAQEVLDEIARGDEPKSPGITADTLPAFLSQAVATEDHPLVYLFERSTGEQLLVHVYADGEADLAERPKDGESWSPPIAGVAR
jgi:hypothetical protein